MTRADWVYLTTIAVIFVAAVVLFLVDVVSASGVPSCGGSPLATSCVP